MNKKFWTSKEDAFIKQNYIKLSVNIIAKKLNRTINAIKLRANKLGQFSKLINNKCFYCGSVKEKPSGTRQNKYNGIDRLDNTKGYTDKNCVSCCQFCHYLKGARFNKIEFIEQINRIYHNLNKG